MKQRCEHYVPCITRIKELEKALSFSKLETEARELMITRAEELFNISQTSVSIWHATLQLLSQDLTYDTHVPFQ